MLINKLVERANKSTNTKEANKIRKSLIIFGINGIFFGALGVVICLLFTSILFYDLLTNATLYDFPTFLIPLFLTILFATLALFGTLALFSGLSLVIVQKTSEFIDDNVYCPNCNNLTGNDKYCNKCGTSVFKDRICNTCKTLNTTNATFCKECGKSI